MRLDNSLAAYALVSAFYPDRGFTIIIFQENFAVTAATVESRHQDQVDFSTSKKNEKKGGTMPALTTSFEVLAL